MSRVGKQFRERDICRRRGLGLWFLLGRHRHHRRGRSAAAASGQTEAEHKGSRENDK